MFPIFSTSCFVRLSPPSQSRRPARSRFSSLAETLRVSFRSSWRSNHHLVTSAYEILHQDTSRRSELTACPCSLHAALSHDPGTRTQQWSVIEVSSPGRRGSDLLSQRSHEVVTSCSIMNITIEEEQPLAIMKRVGTLQTWERKVQWKELYTICRSC